MATTTKPVTVTVTFTCDSIHSQWVGREGTELAGKTAGFLNLAEAEIVSISAVDAEGAEVAASASKGYGRDRGRLSFAVEVPQGKAKAKAKAKAPAAKAPAAKAPAAKAPAAKAPAADARIEALEANMAAILDLLQKK